MEYGITVVVAFVAGLATGRFWLTLAVIAALSLLGWVIVVGEDRAADQAVGTAVALGALIAVVFSVIAGVGAWAGVALRRRLRQP